MGKLKLLNQFQQYCREKTKQKIQLLLVLLFVSSNVFSKGYSQTELRLNFKNTKIENVIAFIEKRTDYRFLYQTSEVNLKKKVNINYKGNISSAVNMLFNGTNVYPVIINKQIILKKRVKFDQNRVLSGTVTDEDAIPLEGVNVLVNGFERGTSTNIDGQYKISVKTGDKVAFSYIGFKEQIFTIANQKIINVTLKEDVDILDEVVLIGYGKEKRENVATAIATIKGNTVQTNLQTGESFDRGLDGLVKGVFVTQGTGELGGGADIIIRGVTSPFTENNNNNPLYVIDGVAISTSGDYNGINPLQSINPNDIESVDILKDAAATAIYGSRGANGVILIKTKTGIYDQPTTVDLSFKTTFGKPIKTLDFLNAKEFKNYILTLNKNSFDYYNSLQGAEKENYGQNKLSRLDRFGFYFDDTTGEYSYDPSRIKFGNADTKWSDEVFRTAVTNSISASVKGGGSASFYNLSLAHVNQEGILKADKKKQYNARFATQFDITEKVKVGLSANYSNININTGYSSSSGQFFTTLGAGVLRFRPDLPVYDNDGNLSYDRFASQSFGGRETVTLHPNPLAISTLSGQANRLDNTLLTNIFAEYNINEDFMFKAEYSYGVFFSDYKMFKPKEYSISGFNPNPAPIDPNDPLAELYATQEAKTELNMNENKVTNSTINYTLNYDKQFGKNNVKGLLGFSHNEEQSIIKNSIFKDFIANYPFPQYAKEVHPATQDISTSGLNSYFTRLSYNYDDKYGVTAVVRLDRSSRFAPENRNAFFPSIAANWNMHRENFMNSNFLTELRLRASAGLTGSVTVGDFDYVQRFNNLGGVNYNGNPSFNFTQNFANRKLQWEKTTEYNLGLDFQLKRAILSGSIDFYHRTTSDVVSKEFEIVETGADYVQKNNAKIQNKGFEISLASDIIRNENFRWSVSANAAKNINKVVEVSGEITSDPSFSEFYVVGREINLLRGYVVNGIIQTQDRIDELNAKAPNGIYDTKSTGPGDYEYKDLNGDGKIDSQDRTILGSRQPDLFGGFNTNVAYKGIELGANFSYAYGLQSFRYNQAIDFGRFFNVERYLGPENRWSPTNNSATLPKLIHAGDSGTNANSRPSSVNVYDSSYLRLTSLKLGYTLPEHFISNTGFSRVNLYIVGTNLITWTSFPGLDPQGTIGGGAAVTNTDNWDAYPAAKTFAMGLNLQF